MDFVYRENSNDGFEVYNTKIGDIYFSNVGAYTEALEKFVVPAFPHIKNKNKIKILDVCYGMGYNSKTFVNFLKNNNTNIEIEIDAIDIDKNILALGLFIFDKNIKSEIHQFFGHNLMEQLDLSQNIENLLGENWIKDVFMKNMAYFDWFNLKKGVDLYQNEKIRAFLHNIYYQNQLKSCKNLKFNIFCDDLTKLLPNFEAGYDLIFHDAFSILKQPALWEKDVMSHYHRILANYGVLLTYSNSRVLRRNLNEIGFDVQVNYDQSKRQNGTIAIKT